ncbi:MAG: hypothetical protein GTO03_02040, partial [Planctomycetales bacterium]|nr:hypothetical protein [Planctomycetales bacterium]
MSMRVALPIAWMGLILIIQTAPAADPVEDLPASTPNAPSDPAPDDRPPPVTLPL